MEKRVVFVYGSLMAEEVISKLISRVPKHKKAFVLGYKRHKLKSKPYPAAYPSPLPPSSSPPSPSSSFESKINGLLLFINENEEKILDEFEGEEYEKKIVSAVALNEKNEQEIIGASIYIYRDENELLKEEEWNFDDFKTNLNSFLINDPYFIDSSFPKSDQ